MRDVAKTFVFTKLSLTSFLTSAIFVSLGYETGGNHGPKYFPTDRIGLLSE
jgi:hypothetical protein